MKISSGSTAVTPTFGVSTNWLMRRSTATLAIYVGLVTAVTVRRHDVIDNTVNSIARCQVKVIGQIFQASLT